MNVRLLLPLLGVASLQCGAAPTSTDAAVEASSGDRDAPRRVVDLFPGTPGIERERREGDRPASRFPAGTTIFLRNPDPTRFCVVRIEGDLSTSRECATVTGFTFGEAAAVSDPIAPGGVASLCFHEPGRYPFEVSGGAGPLAGVFEVVPR
jgi:hypothetical protein